MTVGLRIVAAVAIMLALSVQAWADLTYGTFTWAELPGYFTPLAALAAVVALVAAAVSRAKGSQEPAWVSLLRVNAATYGVVTGAVYWSFLGGIATPVFPWANFILHGGAGAILVTDWLLVGGRERLPLSSVWTVLLVPGMWVSYLLVRAHIDGWVPYPFLDPALGTVTVVTTVGIIAGVGLVVAGTLHLIVRPGAPAPAPALLKSRQIHTSSEPMRPHTGTLARGKPFN